MLFIINADGTVQTTFPSQVYQGSNAASDIIVVAPLPNATADVCFTLPNGASTKPYVMSFAQEVDIGTLAPEGTTFGAWRVALPFAITEYSGTVTAQFRFYTETQIIASAAATFNVEKGSLVSLPEIPDISTYQDILLNISILQNGLHDKLDKSDVVQASGSNPAVVMSQEAVTEYVYTTVQEAIEYIDGEVNDKISLSEQATLNEAKEYTDTRDAQTLSESKSYADSKSAQTLSDANSYADTKSAQALNDAKSYADAKDAQTLSEAKQYTDEKVSQFDIITIVSELPATGEPNRLYLLTKTGGTSGDLFDEYVWENGAWERVGSASVDLSGYATTAQLSGYLEKVSTSTGQIRTYGVTSEGAQQMYIVEKSATSQSIARRDSGGVLSVSAATAAGHAVNLGQMESYVAENAISLTTTGTIEPVAGSRVMTLGSNGNVILIEGNPSSYMLVGVKSNGDPVMYKPNNYSAESQTVAVRGTGGVLVVGTPTAANHATTKQYVDAKCVTYTISTDTGYWYDAPVSGPPDQQDARAVLLSDIGVNITGAKGFMWTLHNEGYEGESGCSALVPCNPVYNGGKVQIDTEELYILGSQTIYRFLNLIVFY